MKKIILGVLVIIVFIFGVKSGWLNEPTPAERREKLQEIYGDKANCFIFYDL